MYLNDQIKQLENQIEKLKSNNLPLEKQIDLYNDTLKDVGNIQKKLQQLKSSVLTESIPEQSDATNI